VVGDRGRVSQRHVTRPRLDNRGHEARTSRSGPPMRERPSVLIQTGYEAVLRTGAPVLAQLFGRQSAIGNPSDEVLDRESIRTMPFRP